MFKKMKQSYKNMAIRKKMIVMFVAIIVFFMTLVLVISNKILYHSNIAKIRQNIQDECSVINLRISTMYDNLKICQNSVIQGINQIYEETEIEELDEISFLSIKNSLLSVLNYYKRCFSDVDSMVFVDNWNNVVSTDLPYTVKVEEIEDLLGELKSGGPVVSRIFPVEKRKSFGGTAEDAVLTLGIRIILIDTGENLGYLFVNVKTDKIAEIFPVNDEGIYQKNYYIIDEQGRMIAGKNLGDRLLEQADPDLLQKAVETREGSFETIVNNEACLVTIQENMKFGWRFVNEVPIKSIVRDVNVMSAIIVIVGLFCIILAVVLILVLSELITNPVKALTATAEKISGGELSCRCVVDRKDEVGVLAKTFNSMLERIENLLGQVKQEQKRKRETELALFQIQIKPHFLYNTLDLIYVCCEMEDGKTGGKIAKALADYYRTCLSGGAEVISVGEELRNIENYLLIQQERYSDILEYSIELPEECRKYRIPKMTLQPLVENAIYHGLKEKGTRGHIQIRVRTEKETVVLEVADDGAGMDPQRFAEILKKKDEKNKEHFGLNNVHERIRLYFGEEYGLSIDPDEETGTRILIRIPKAEVYDG